MMNKEVLTIPASGTIDIIYKHGIHAYPHPRSYYDSPFVAFRKKGGVVETLYSVQEKVVLDPNSSDLQIEVSHLSADEQERLLTYIIERKRSYFGFEKPEQSYMFWVLKKEEELQHKPQLINNTAGHIYFARDKFICGEKWISNK